LFMMTKAGFLDELGEENVCANIDLALARAREILNQPGGGARHFGAIGKSGAARN